jgi:hypothetical protein
MRILKNVIAAVVCGNGVFNNCSRPHYKNTPVVEVEKNIYFSRVFLKVAEMARVFF